MKKIYTTIIIVFICWQANAQIDAGQFLLGGNLTYETSSIKFDGSKFRLSEFAFSPSAGVFIINKLATGFRISFDGQRQRDPDGPVVSYSERSVSFSPFARYYILNKNKSYNIFLDASFDFYRLKRKYHDQNSRDYEGSGHTLSGGPVFFISKQVALELAFGYTRRYHLDMERLTRINTSLGLQFHFPGNKK